MRPSSHGSRTRRSFALVAIAGLLVLAACTVYRWQAQPITELSTTTDSLKQRDVRFDFPGGGVTLAVTRLEFPYVYGRVTEFQPSYVNQSGVSVAVSRDDLANIRLAAIDVAPSPTPGATLGLSADSTALNGHTLFLDTHDGTLIVRDAHVTADGIEGHLVAGMGPVRINLTGLQGMLVREIDPGKTFFRAATVATATVAVVALVVALTKSSCPFAYADTGTGWTLAGEAYAGAAFRSTQRNDLLPLPSPGSRPTFRIELRNEARETQYTDRAELVLVDHAADVRALSTFDQRAVLVGPASPAMQVRDAAGRDLARAVANVDGMFAERDPDAVATTPDSVVADVITAEFARPTRGVPVLEIVAGNTALLDLTFGRFFAAMGNHLNEYLAKGADSSAGPRIRGWLEREGVDLIVEVQDANGWRRVAVVPTAGPASMREIAIPLPVTNGAGPLVVRLRSGLGFWRFDRIALSTLDTATPRVVRVSPTRAMANGSRDERATIAANDARYQALVQMGDSLVMEFALPPLPRGQVRSAFLSSSGYYTVHPPLEAAWLPMTLKTIRDQPGAFSRFARDLARAYQRAEQVASARR